MSPKQIAALLRHEGHELSARRSEDGDALEIGCLRCNEVILDGMIPERSRRAAPKETERG